MKVWIKTFGCQMNYHDTERVLHHLQDLDFTRTDNISEADLVLFNTCAIRDLANSKFYSHLGETKHQKNVRDVIIGVCGCIGQLEGEQLLKKYKHLDFVFGTDQIDNITEMVSRALAGDRKFIFDAYDSSRNYSIETKITHNTPQAFVNIIKGCNNFCTYCIVPFTRGREKSRTITEVVEDVKKLIEDKGIQEITLLGQNVNAFGKDTGESFPKLLIELEQLDTNFLLRYTTSHPYYITDELIEVHRVSKKLANHIHLPVQSGSNSVLKRMGRKYTVEHYLGLLKKFRKACPTISISSDIIVGFPNETEDEFNETMKLIEIAKYDNIYSYKFSPRPGTKAAKIDDVLTNEVRGARLQLLQKSQNEIQKSVRSRLIGDKFKIMVDGYGEMGGIKKWKGRSSCNRLIHFKPDDDSQDYAWQWVEVEVTSATAFSCQAKLV